MKIQFGLIGCLLWALGTCGFVTDARAQGSLLGVKPERADGGPDLSKYPKGVIVSWTDPGGRLRGAYTGPVTDDRVLRPMKYRISAGALTWGSTTMAGLAYDRLFLKDTVKNAYLKRLRSIDSYLAGFSRHPVSYPSVTWKKIASLERSGTFEHSEIPKLAWSGSSGASLHWCTVYEVTFHQVTSVKTRNDLRVELFNLNQSDSLEDYIGYVAASPIESEN